MARIICWSVICFLVTVTCSVLAQPSLDAADNGDLAEKDSPSTEVTTRPPRAPASSRILLPQSNTVDCRMLFGDTPPTARAIFSLTESNEDLTASGLEIKLPDGSTISRLKHTVDNVEVWDSGATVTELPKVRGLCSSGPTKILGASSPILLGPQARTLSASSTPSSQNSSIALCRRRWEVSSRDRVENQTAVRVVYKLENGSFTYADKVELTGIDGARDVLFRVFCMVDAVKNNVIEAWDALQFFYGDGGNRKTQKYRYGVDRPKLPATPTTGANCAMRNPEGTVKIHDMGGQTASIKKGSTPVATYNCQNGADDAINGAYSPLDDCFFNADLVAKFLTDPEWSWFTDLKKYTPGGVFYVAAHFKQRYDNAFWDGNGLYIGDGSFTFYPLCTCTDVIAHEMGHSVTQMLSDLVYEGEPGCLNEAFSDIMAEAVENYFRNGTNDFKIGGDCMKSGSALRDMTQPSSVNSFDSDSDPHHCSAVFNYAFYRIATSPGWSTKLAFRVFLMANALFWRQKTKMRQAACDVATAASRAKLGVDLSHIVAAFKAVDIDVSQCVTSGGGDILTTPSTTSARITSTTATTQARSATTTMFTWHTLPTSLTKTTTRVTTTTTSRMVSTTRAVTTTSSSDDYTDSDGITVLENCDGVYDISADTGEKKYFKVVAPKGSHSIFAYMVGTNGDADLYIKYGSAPTLTSYGWRSYRKASVEWVMTSISQTGPYYIMINAAKGYTGLDLKACFS